MLGIWSKSHNPYTEGHHNPVETEMLKQKNVILCDVLDMFRGHLWEHVEGTSWLRGSGSLYTHIKFELIPEG